MSRHRVATVPGVTKRLIEELEKIVKPRQKSVKAVRERFGFTKATKTECSRQEEAGMSDHGLDRDGWPSADTVLESTRRELSAAQADIKRLRAENKWFKEAQGARDAEDQMVLDSLKAEIERLLEDGARLDYLESLIPVQAFKQGDRLKITIPIHPNGLRLAIDKVGKP